MAEERDTRGAERGGKMPPVDFSSFALGLGQMALVHLGEVPDPATGEGAEDPAQARHAIDILDMLEAKTRGNLTAEEAELLHVLQGELKLKYVRVVRKRGG